MASDFDGGDLPEQGKRRLSLTWPTIWKSLAVLIGILVVGLLVTLLARSLQSSAPPTPDGTAAAFASTMTSIYDQQATFTAAAITPTIDPNVAALQTQNALLIQNGTAQAEANQASLSQPSATAQPVQVITQIVPVTVPAQVQPTTVVVLPPTQTLLVIDVTTTTPPLSVSIQEGDKCPEGITDIAALIGGQVQYWTPPTYPDGAWVYKNKGNFVPVKYPGFGRLDVWIDGAVSIYDTNKNLLSNTTFDEVSFHCHKTVADCPTTPGGVADLVGGQRKYWYLLPDSGNSGWKYRPGSPAVTMTAPNFGHVDFHSSKDDNRIQNGQQANDVTEATFWCGG